MIIECHMRNVVHTLSLAPIGPSLTALKKSAQIASCLNSTVHCTKSERVSRCLPSEILLMSQVAFLHFIII